MTPPIAFCRECGEQFVQVPYTKIFCSTPCTKRHHGRRIMGGLQLYDAAMKWRLDNSRAKKGLLTELTAVADRLAGEEREILKAREARIKKLRSSVVAAFANLALIGAAHAAIPPEIVTSDEIAAAVAGLPSGTTEMCVLEKAGTEEIVAMWPPRSDGQCYMADRSKGERR